MQITQSPKVAAEYIQQGKLVLFPTETVYGIGASAFIESACLQIYKVKNRPQDNPFIIHVSSVEEIFLYAKVEEYYKDLIKALVPGPITFVLPKRETRLFSTGLPTVALRIPDHPLVLEFLALAGPVSAPSANLSGRPSITLKSDLLVEFQGKVDLFLEGNEPNIGIESTVVDLTSPEPTLLRPGKVTYSRLLKYFPNIKKNNYKKIDKPLSPGLKYRHYSPNCKVLWYEGEILQPELSGFLGFSLKKTKLNAIVVDNLEYMRKLYSFFIECDRLNLSFAYCEKPLEDEFADILYNRIEKAIGM